MFTKNQEALRLIVRTREDFQKIRKSINNRLGLKNVKMAGKKDDKRLIYDLQDTPDIGVRGFEQQDQINLAQLSLKAMIDEKTAEHMLTGILKRFKVYNDFLNTEKALGCADIASGWMLSEFDIEEATTVSKMNQFAGVNPDLIRGKKSVKEKEYKKTMGDIIGDLPEMRNGVKRVMVLTNEFVRGDKATPGFLLPYNKNLKRVLMGILASNMIKAQGPYVQNFYYPYKTRLANSDKEVLHNKKMVAWKDVSDGHRDFAARRYMIKKFLVDFHIAWRTSENLSIREPYPVEYLGKKHHQL